MISLDPSEQGFAPRGALIIFAPLHSKATTVMNSSTFFQKVNFILPCELMIVLDSIERKNGQ